MYSRIICLDSMISAWVFRDETPPVNEMAEFQKANSLMQKLSDKDYKILVPNLVLSEISCTLTESLQNYFFSSLPNGIVKCDFTEKTARILARILHTRFFAENKDYQNKGITKAQMKYDSLILACAVDAEAEWFYTVDNGFKKYSTQFIPIKGLDDLPDSYDEGTLFNH